MVIRQNKTSGSKEAAEMLLKREFPEDVWEALTKKVIDKLLAMPGERIYVPYYNRRGNKQDG